MCFAAIAGVIIAVGFKSQWYDGVNNVLRRDSGGDYSRGF